LPRVSARKKRKNQSRAVAIAIEGARHAVPPRWERESADLRFCLKVFWASEY
jgi:hypothetical protein